MLRRGRGMREYVEEGERVGGGGAECGSVDSFAENELHAIQWIELRLCFRKNQWKQLGSPHADLWRYETNAFDQSCLLNIPRDFAEAQIHF